MASQLEELFDGVREGRWIFPDSTKPNPVALANAIAAVCGVSRAADDEVDERLRALIGEPEHLVFVIADGFGMNLMNHLPENSFCRSYLALESRAAFPSSTGPNLFSFSRAQWPGEHGNIGWYVHLAELGERAALLPWVRTRDQISLTDLGLTDDVVFPGPPFVAGI